MKTSESYIIIGLIFFNYKFGYAFEEIKNKTQAVVGIIID